MFLSYINAGFLKLSYLSYINAGVLKLSYLNAGVLKFSYLSYLNAGVLNLLVLDPFYSLVKIKGPCPERQKESGLLNLTNIFAVHRT